MPLMKRNTETKPASDFLSRYTRDNDGFYVRNVSPSPETLSEKRIADNLRDLLKDFVDSKSSDNE